MGWRNAVLGVKKSGKINKKHSIRGTSGVRGFFNPVPIRYNGIAEGRPRLYHENGRSLPAKMAVFVAQQQAALSLRNGVNPI